MFDTVSERIFYLRKNELKKTQDEFGDMIGVARNSVANYENGRRTPSEAVLKLICREFNVNYSWLSEGVGDIFSDVPATILDEVAVEFDLDEFERCLLLKYFKLDRKNRDAFRDFITDVVSEYKKEE